MSFFSRLIARAFRLPPAETFDLQIERNLRIPMLDGVVLLADHYAPPIASDVDTTYGSRYPAAHFHAGTATWA